MTLFDLFKSPSKFFGGIFGIVEGQFESLLTLSQTIPKALTGFLGGVGQTAELLPILILGGLAIAGLFLVKDLIKD